MKFGTNISCPKRGCKGEVQAQVASIEPLEYVYSCTKCKQAGTWDHLVQLKHKVAKFHGKRHSYPKTATDEFLLATKRIRQKKEDLAHEYERVRFEE